MSSVNLIDKWRTTIFRLVLLYGALFAGGVVLLLTLVYFSAANYIDQQIDQVLNAELHSYAVTPAGELPGLVGSDIRRDARQIEVYGLFARNGEYIAGNIARIPENLPSDSLPHSIGIDAAILLNGPASSIRALRAEHRDGITMVLGRKETQVREIQHIVAQALGGAVVVILIGTSLGIWLSKEPIDRIRRMQRISQQIIHGDLALRLPVSGHNDELDTLARIVNQMLDEIEQRMQDIKGASDNVAHNLRAPLTRVRASLGRLLQIPKASADFETGVGQALDEVDHLLFRFRALLRISEISGSLRRAAFENVDVNAILRNVRDVYEPMAEEKKIDLGLLLPEGPRMIFGDGALLFEAILNLVDNAVKFTPPGGEVRLIAGEDRSGVFVEVQDTGMGIPEKELDMVMKSFYRGEAGRLLPGSGVGLSIVAAIARLHHFRFEISSHPGRTSARLMCHAEERQPDIR